MQIVNVSKCEYITMLILTFAFLFHSNNFHYGRERRKFVHHKLFGVDVSTHLLSHPISFGRRSLTFVKLNRQVPMLQRIKPLKLLLYTSPPVHQHLNHTFSIHSKQFALYNSCER